MNSQRPNFAEPFGPVLRARSKRWVMRRLSREQHTAVCHAWYSLRDAAKNELRQKIGELHVPNTSGARARAATARMLILAFGRKQAGAR